MTACFVALRVFTDHLFLIVFRGVLSLMLRNVRKMKLRRKAGTTDIRQARLTNKADETEKKIRKMRPRLSGRSNPGARKKQSFRKEGVSKLRKRFEQCTADRLMERAKFQELLALDTVADLRQ
jgi:hypothetical protein